MSVDKPPPLRAAVIGCGTIAYEHLPFLAASSRAELVAVCDRSPALAEAARARFGAATACQHVADMLDAARPQVVHVLTPAHTHAPMVRQALAAGAHVICEKPMTGRAEETAALLAEARAAGLSLMESRNYLYNDTILELRGMIDAGRLGRVVECDLLLSLDFLSGPFGDTNLSGPAVDVPGGAIQDFLPHLAYLYLLLTGTKRAEAVRGFLANRSGNPRARFDFLDALVMSGDARGRLRIAADVEPDMFRLVLRGTQATVETDLYNPYIRFEGAPNTGKRTPLGQVENGLALVKAGIANFRNKVMQHGTYHGLPRMLDAIYAAIQTGGPMPFSDEEILATALLTDRIMALGNAS
jgi:predicted dehydrogenase